jgi:hypothetical protein
MCLSAEAQALSDHEIIREAREAFERAADAEAENRREALDDLRFARLGEQWPASIKRERDLDGRPCLTINRLPAFIRQGAQVVACDAARALAVQTHTAEHSLEDQVTSKARPPLR